MENHSPLLSPVFCEFFFCVTLCAKAIFSPTHPVNRETDMKGRLVTAPAVGRRPVCVYACVCACGQVYMGVYVCVH